MKFPATFTDQMGHEIKLTAPPQRFISLVPSQTELLYDLGLRDEVVGITKFCIHPKEWFRTKPRIGGTKQFNFDKIAELKPDLIIGNKEENEEEQVRELLKTYPVWMSDIHNLGQALTMINSLGQLTGHDQQALKISREIIARFEIFQLKIANIPERSAAYLIWRNPFMAAGSNTFIDSMMQTIHLKNVITSGRYPETTLSELAHLAPEFLLLSSEPYPFSEKHFAEIQKAIPSAKIVLVDGEMFSWYGTRLLQAPAYFTELLGKLAHM